MKLKERIIAYWTEEPKSSFWMWAFITLLFFRYVTPTMLIMMIPLQIGLIAPEAEIDYGVISTNVAENIVGTLESLHDAGKRISQDNPLTAKILFYSISYFVWVIWFMMIVLILNLFRYLVSYIIRKGGTKQCRGKKRIKQKQKK